MVNTNLYISLLSVISIIIHLILILFYPKWANFPLFILLVVGGIPLLKQILAKILSRDIGADLLAALALITGCVLKEFLAASFIVLMLATGQALERYATQKASSVLFALAKRMPRFAHRQMADKIEDIHLEDIHVHDLIVVYPHETCPVDGIVFSGYGSMDESYLTGEPYEISKAPGSLVLSGAINGQTALVIKTTKLIKDSRYTSILKVLQEAEHNKPNMRKLADHIGAIFTPIALGFALLAWYLSSDPQRFLAVLVIATPCPLLIAVPITLISAVSKAAKQAIIIKDTRLLEQLPLCKTAIFDKTGTLTYGKPTLTHIECYSEFKPHTILQLCASLECYSKHPLAYALLKEAKDSHIPLIEPTKVTEVPGKGLTGIINSQEIVITGRKQLSRTHLQRLSASSSGLECIILINDELAAVLHFHDAPRPESKSFLNHLQPFHQLSKLMLVSGDRYNEVQYLANQLNIQHVFAEQSPEQKLDIVRQETKLNPTVFMGDGINDAPALTAATVGIAFGEYSDVTAAAAGAVIMENTFNKVDELLHLCKDTRLIALQSAFGGMFLSLIGMFIAALGYIPPVSGAIIQELIDVLAIINALRLTWTKTIKIDIPHKR